MPIDYWCATKLAVDVAGPDSTFTTHVDKPFAMVGTRRDCEIVVPNKQLSRRKFYLHAVDDGIFFLDLAPRWSGGPMHGWIEAGDKLQFGEYEITVNLKGHETALCNPEAHLTDRGSLDCLGPTLDISTGEKKVCRQIISRRLTLIGRKSPSTITVSSRTISRVHCALFFDGEDLWVIDLKTRGGTRFNGCKIDAVKYAWGVPLRIGRLNVVCDLPWTLTAGEKIAKQNAQVAAQHEHLADASVATNGTPPPSVFDLKPPIHEARRRAKYLSMKNAVRDQSTYMPEPSENASAGELLRRRLELEREKFKWARFCKKIKKYLTSELDQLETLRGELDGCQQQLRQQQSQLAIDIEQLQHAQLELEQANSHLASERQSQGDQHAERASELEAQQNELNQFKCQLDKRKREHDTSLQALESQQRQLENQRQEFQQLRDAELEEHRELQSDLARQNSLLSLREQEIDAVARQLDVDRSDLDQERGQLQVERQNLLDEHAAESNAIDQLRSDFENQKKLLEQSQLEHEAAVQQFALDRAHALERDKSDLAADMQQQREQLENDKRKWNELCQAEQAQFEEEKRRWHESCQADKVRLEDQKRQWAESCEADKTRFENEKLQWNESCQAGKVRFEDEKRQWAESCEADKTRFENEKLQWNESCQAGKVRFEDEKRQWNESLQVEKAQFESQKLEWTELREVQKAQYENEKRKWNQSCEAEKGRLAAQIQDVERKQNEVNEQQQQLEKSRSTLIAQQDQLIAERQQLEVANSRLAIARRELQEQLVEKIAETDRVREKLTRQQSLLERREQKRDARSKQVALDNLSSDQKLTDAAISMFHHQANVQPEIQSPLPREIEKAQGQIAQRQEALDQAAKDLETERSQFKQEVLQLEAARQKQQRQWKDEIAEIDELQREMEQGNLQIEGKQVELDEAVKQLESQRLAIQQEAIEFASAREQQQRHMDELVEELERQRHQFEQEQLKAIGDNTAAEKQIAEQRDQLAAGQGDLKKRERDLDQQIAAIVDRKVNELVQFRREWQDQVSRMESILTECKRAADRYGVSQQPASPAPAPSLTLLQRVKNRLAVLWGSSN